jgi:hypothetical protein
MEVPVVGEWTLRLADGPLLPRILEAESYAAARAVVLAESGWKRLPPYSHLHQRQMQELRFVQEGSLVRLRNRRWGIFSQFQSSGSTLFGFVDLEGLGRVQILRPPERVEVILAPVGCARWLIQLAAQCGRLQGQEEE